ncbi:MAG: hypothetical protein ABL977_15785, partial [Candidatus Eisenbacteria bacterium]
SEPHPGPAALGAVLAAEEIRPRRTDLIGIEAVIAAHDRRLGAALHHTARIPAVSENEWWKWAATNAALGLASDSLHTLTREGRWAAADSLISQVERQMPRGDKGWAKQARARLREIAPRTPER